MDGSSTGSGGCKAARSRSGDLGVLGRLPKLDNFCRPLLNPADSGESADDDEAGDIVMRLGA